MATRQSAIRSKCMDCCAEDATGIRCCTVVRCPLWPFRMGYKSGRNRIYYDRELYLDHLDEAQESFNRFLKEVHNNASETA